MVWKKVVNSDPGDADHFGGNDLDKVSDLFSGSDVDDVDMNADFSFRSGRLKALNPAGTFTTTYTNPAITANKDAFLSRLTYDYTLAKVGTTYYALDKDQTIVTSGTNLQTVMQAVIDQMETDGSGTMYVPSLPLGSAWILPTTFTGLTIGNDSDVDVVTEVNIVCSKGAYFKVPNDFAGTFCTFTDGTERCGWYGGHLYASASQYLYTAFDFIGTTDDGSNYWNVLEEVHIRDANIGIKLTNDGALGSCNGHYFNDVLMVSCNNGVVFDQAVAYSSGANGINRNLFNNVIMEVNNRVDGLYGFKDVSGRDNYFHHCKVWDILQTAAYHTCTVTANSEYAQIHGGVMTQVGWPADNLSSTTFVNDMWSPTRMGKGLIYADVAKTANFTATLANDVIRADATGGAFTVTLPTAVGVSGRQITVKRTDILASSALVTIATTSSQTIDGAAAHYLWPAEYVVLESDGANWQVINRTSPGPYTYYAIKGSSADRRIMAGNQGGYAGTISFLTSTTSPAANTLWALPLILYKTTKCDLISFRDTTASTAGNSRLGLYRDSGNCYPGALIFDSGAIDTTGAAGIKNSTITSGLQTMSAGLYWLTYEADTATGQIMSLGTTGSIFGIFESISFNAPIYGYSVAHTFGALPNPYTGGATVLNAAPAQNAPVPAIGLRPI